MRIPVSSSDLDQGRFTKISRALQKLWPFGPLSLMQAQNTLAGLFGYRNMHDLQSQAGPPRELQALSRATLVQSVTWQLYRHHGMPLMAGADLAAKLHLSTLDIDHATIDAASERFITQHGKKGETIMIDEASSAFNPYWNPKTPQLLDYRLPGYAFAVLPDKRVFRWNELERVIALLPTDFLDDLRWDKRYADLATDGARELTFIANEVYPQACCSLVEAAKDGRILPEGFEIVWLFDAGGACIGRTLSNKSLGGLIPAVYGIADDGIYDAIGGLLCGDTIPAAPVSGNLDGSPVYVLRFGYGGYDLAQDLRRYLRRYDAESHIAPDKAATRDLDRLPEHIRFSMVDGRPILTGRTFVEQGQTYIRHQEWLSAADVPDIIMPKDEIARRLRDSTRIDDESVVPEAVAALFGAVNTRKGDLFAVAATRLQSSAGIDDLVKRFLVSTSPDLFDAYCDAMIDDYLPIRYEDDTEDNPSLVEKRKGALWEIDARGVKIRKAIPSLSVFKSTSLGLILLRAYGEYPGGRYSWSAQAPNKGAFDKLVHYLGYLLLHSIYCMSRTEEPSANPVAEALAFAVDAVVYGTHPMASLPVIAKELSVFCGKLTEHQKRLQAIESWLYADADMRTLRAQGQFLHVGTKIPRERPKGLADQMIEARGKGIVTTVAQQTGMEFSSLHEYSNPKG